MKVVFAPDKFAGTLTAAEAAAAMARGWRRVRPDDTTVSVPMADGGEGTLAVVAAAVPSATPVSVEVADARGRPVIAAWLRLPGGRALVEAAQACGLWRLTVEERDPLETTTYGVGQLLVAAAAAGASTIVVGLGGSATVDGGAGMAIALGHRLLRADGNGVKVGGGWLHEVVRVVPGPPLGGGQVRVIAATDVTNPLLGPDGAAAVFGPQKGADTKAVAVLENGLARYADVVERDIGRGRLRWRDRPGAGAAGGLGFALMALCGAEVQPGAQAVADLVGLDDALDGADVVVTGEGSLDAQSAAGKAPIFVADRARRAGARVFAIAGRLQHGAGDRFDVAVDLGPDGPRRAAQLVEARSAELAATL